MLGRALLAISILGMTLHHAAAQFGGMPGLPGGPSTGGFGGQQQGPPPKCQALLVIRDELQKDGQAISTVNSKGADVKIACRLFRKYLATEGKLIKMLEADGASCGAPAQVLQQVRDSHIKARRIGQQVCDAAARGSLRGMPTLYDALNPSPPPSEVQRPFLYDGLWPPNRRP